jgi:Zn-dependent peptidase ImmA (M78 family)
VTGLTHHGPDPAALECVLEERMRFSAVTVFRGTRCGIFYNPHHSARRRANSIAHEISHVILEHTPGPAVTQDGLRNWNAQQEAEADWQSGALLVPRDGALHWMAGGGEYTDGAAHFGVSARLFSWRVKHTGVERQLQARVAVR